MKFSRKTAGEDCRCDADPLPAAPDTEDAAHVVALAGNPNTGKSTVFNALTGLRQHTGNWPGKTVTRMEGRAVYGTKRYRLIDLPGTYSLLSASTDEEITRDFLLFHQPDCTVVVVDATALQRNLNLVLQILEITDKVVVCVNLMDEARRKGLVLNLSRLSGDLGVPVVGTTARRREGLEDLLAAAADVIEGRLVTDPYRPTIPVHLKAALDKLLPMIDELAPGLPNARWIAYRLIEGDHSIRQAVASGALRQLGGAAVRG